MIPLKSTQRRGDNFLSVLSQFNAQSAKCSSIALASIAFACANATTAACAAQVIGQVTGVASQSSALKHGSLSDSASIPARSVDDFIDSIGLNVHLYYNDAGSIYFFHYDDVIRPMLLQLGVRHLRDGCVERSPGDAYYPRISDLGANGIKFDLVCDPRSVSVSQALSLVKLNCIPWVESIEGPNEYDSGNAASVYVPTVRTYMSQLASTFRADSATAGLPIIGPSFISTDASTLIGDLSAWTNYGNAHSYNYPNNPGSVSVDQDIATRSLPFPGEPMIETESGYFTASQASGTVSEMVQAKYIPRLFLDNFNRGVARTMAYEFADEGTDPTNHEENWGLLHNDGSIKPSFTSMKNLISLLQDNGSKVNPAGNLACSLTDPSGNVRQTLLEKSNGTFDLVLWLEVPSSDATTSRTVTLNVTASTGGVNVYTSGISALAQSSYPASSSQSLTLAVPDQPLVVEIIPTTVTEASPNFKLVSVGSVARSGGAIRATVVLQNNGGPAFSTQVTSANLATTDATSGAPAVLGTVTSGGTTTLTLAFPAASGAKGQNVFLNVNGTYTGGNFSVSRRLVLP